MWALKASELGAPEPFALLQPAQQVDHGFGPQGIDAHARVELGMALLDQAAGAQRAQVAAHGRRGDVQLARQLAGRPRPLGQQVDDAPPVRVGQGGQGLVEGGGGGHQIGRCVVPAP